MNKEQNKEIDIERFSRKRNKTTNNHIKEVIKYEISNGQIYNTREEAEYYEKLEDLTALLKRCGFSFGEANSAILWAVDNIEELKELSELQEKMEI